MICVVCNLYPVIVWNKQLFMKLGMALILLCICLLYVFQKEL